MSYKVKIFGAGSIGNHLSNASRAMGWSVDLCDLDPAALERTKTAIYPQRYGAWDESITLYQNDAAPKGGYDLIFVGTPPDSHMSLALAAIEEAPKAILVEKPLCGPGLEGAQELVEAAKAKNVQVFVGYDHVVGAASVEAGAKPQEIGIGDIESIDVEFREHWGGIFAAHPWLNGPEDTYLGYWKRGGGASGEHSHAINLWQHFAHSVGVGRIVEVSAMLDYINDGTVDYDKLCVLNVVTENGMIGRVVQDVITNPPRKWARIQGSNGYVEWQCGVKAGVDRVSWKSGTADVNLLDVEKTRPQDFIMELTHLKNVLDGTIQDSPISLERGLDTMLVVAAAHLSAREKRTVRIDYSMGYTPAALKLA